MGSEIKSLALASKLQAEEDLKKPEPFQDVEPFDILVIGFFTRACGRKDRDGVSLRTIYLDRTKIYTVFKENSDHFMFQVESDYEIIPKVDCIKETTLQKLVLNALETVNIHIWEEIRSF